MWAQLIKVRLKPGQDDAIKRLYAELDAIEQPGSGLVRSTAMRDQRDPSVAYMLVVFESEEKARARESDPRRAEGRAKIRELMQEMIDGPPEFVDLVVESEHADR